MVPKMKYFSDSIYGMGIVAWLTYAQEWAVEHLRLSYTTAGGAARQVADA